MQDRDNSALPLGDIHHGAQDSSNSLFVVATVAAILLAGSAIVYRTRPSLPYLPFASPASADNPAAYHTDKKRKTAGEASRDELNAAASGSGSLLPARSTASESDSLLALGSKEKEGKSSRSKDRRRRGKDPLKELLKGGGKKYKALTLAASAHTEKDSSPSHNNIEDPLSESDSNNPSFSLSFASTSFLPDPPSRATTEGKRVQREKPAAATTTTDTPANASMAAQSAAAPSIHNIYSRGPSEVSQKHNRMGDGPSSASGSLENHSHPSQTVPDAHNSFADDRPPSSLDSASLSHSDDGLGRPHSSLSMADSTSSSLLPLAEDQAPHMEDEPFSDNPVRRSRAKGKNRPDNLTGLAFSRSHSASTADTTATGATASASLGSSVLLVNPDVLTPATSPTLSTYASGSGSGSGSGSTQSTLTEHPKPSGAQEPSDSPSAGKSKNSKRKAAEQGASSKNSSKDVTVSERGSPSTKERKPPTPAAVKNMVSSSSHPSLFYSPTKTSFAAAAAAASASSSTLSSSVSASITSATGRSSPLVGVDEHKDGNEKREEEEMFTFPTLNPTPVTERFDAAGPSRLRSDISSPRRAPTPRRPGTPSRSSNTSTPPPLMSPTTASFSAPAGSSSSNHANSNHSNTNSSMPALSTQTQLASLRGALEAARLREEKNKSEMERIGKEMEALRWENVNWRRAESELQTHIRHLMHQVQTYAFLLSSMAPHVNPQVLQQQYHQYTQLHQQQLLQLQQGLQPPPAPMHPQPPASGAANPGGANAGSTPSSTSSAPNVNGSSNINNPITGSSGGVGTPASVPSTPLDASFASPSSTSMTSPIVTPGGSSQAQGQTTQNQSPQQQTPTQMQQPTTTTVPPVLPPLHIQQQMVTAQMNGVPSSAARAVGTPPPPLPMMGMHPGSPTPAPFFPYAIPPPPPPHGYPHPHPGHPHAPFSPHLPTHTPHTHPAQALMLQAQQMQQQFQQAAGGSPSAPQTPNMSMNMFSGMFSPPVMSPHQMHQYPAYAAAVAAQAQMQQIQQIQAVAAAAAVTNSASSSSSNSNSTSTSSAASSLLSMSMGTLSMSGSGPSSASSPGSLSPDLNASPSPGGGKKRRTRLGRGRSTWGDAGDGWIGGGIEGEKSAAGEEGADAEVNGHARDPGDDEGCSDDVFNEIVADAIFKRPASLGVRSSLKRGRLRGKAENAENDKRNEKPEQLTEFTFPSLSDLGNVKYQFRSNVVAVNGGGSNSSVGGSTPSSSSVSASASVSRSMSISPVPQENVPEASGVEKNEEVKEEVAVEVEVEAEVDLVTEAVPTVVPEQPAEEKSAPGHLEVAEVLYDSSTSTDETQRKETSEPSIPVDEPDSSFHETPATAADILSPQGAQ